LAAEGRCHSSNTTFNLHGHNTKSDRLVCLPHWLLNLLSNRARIWLGLISKHIEVVFRLNISKRMPTAIQSDKLKTFFLAVGLILKIDFLECFNLLR